MNKILKYIKNPHNILAFIGGLCIIITALFFKKALNIPVPIIESSLPGFILVIYEALLKKGKLTKPPWSSTWFWAISMLLAACIIILRRIIITA